MAAALTPASLLLRAGDLHTGDWIDEAISVGIGSHDLLQIPAACSRSSTARKPARPRASEAPPGVLTHPQASRTHPPLGG
jgi:hypothetical protein